ncbi:MAG TPA: NAD(P)-dependent alcohol dehydrogenase [Bacteroidales bacterium]|nr:NAD(P)-dependent alcohol dehydrogenase [Bacteroidales bacterium]
MKAAIINQFGTPDVFEVTAIKTPKIKNDQLLIKVMAVSINPIDWKQRKGNHKLILGSPFPIVLGYDVCGEVVETGSEIKQFKKGDKVFGVLDNKYGGALAEFAVAHENCIVHQPENISGAEAAAFPMASLTALQALRDKAGLQKGQSVLILGASGGVGHMAIQIAKIMGAKVIAVSSESSKTFVEQFHPDEFIDYRSQDILSLKQKVDVFFDVAGIYSFPKCKHLLNPGGVYVNTLPRPKILIHKILQWFTNGKKAKTLLMKHHQKDLSQIKQWIEENKISVKIDRSFTLENISEAHAFAQQGHSKGKNVVLMNND